MTVQPLHIGCVRQGTEHLSLHFRDNLFLSFYKGTTHKEPHPYLDPMLLGDEIMDSANTLTGSVSHECHIEKRVNVFCTWKGCE